MQSMLRSGMLYLSANNIKVLNGIRVVKVVSNSDSFVHSAHCVFWVAVSPTANRCEVLGHYYFFVKQHVNCSSAQKCFLGPNGPLVWSHTQGHSVYARSSC